MEEKQYYILGAAAIVIVLMAVTITSYFPSKKETAIESVKAPEKVTEEVKKEEPVVIERKELSTVSEKEDNEKYSINLIKPQGLPSAIQSTIDTIFVTKKEDFLGRVKGLVALKDGEKYVLETLQPQAYESEKYSSVVIEFKESLGNGKPDSAFSTISYDKSSGKAVYLPDIFESENKNNEIYDYLSSYFQSMVMNSILDQARKAGGELSESDKESLRNSVKKGISANSENFLNWYVDNDSVVFIFPPNQVAPYSYGKQEARVYINAMISSLNNSKNGQ
ncbi:MAG: RsiV family protein [Candidatus Pacebacteria bacterium]|nr:RsiV family protein [Candidatus Paceibacterota bacterium]